MAAATRKKKKRKAKRPKVEVNVEELDLIINSAKTELLNETGADKLRTAIHSMAEALLNKRRTTEKTSAVTEEIDPNGEIDKPGESESDQEKDKAKKKPGHGRLKALEYTGAERVPVGHSTLKPGNLCPECETGKLSEKTPKVLVRITGMAPLNAKVYQLQKFRCTICGKTFSAAPPAGIGTTKYDDSVATMLAILKFGYGMPYDRISRMQKSMGIPMPASTQYELLEDAATLLNPIHQELLRQAAQLDLIHIDDTSMKILSVERDPKDKRTGTFTTAIVGVADEFRVSLYCTGTQHAGENLVDLVKERAEELESPILMCDALSWNTSKLEAPDAVILAHCLAHGRRKFIDVAHNFPQACLHVLEELGKVYGFDQHTRDQKMAPSERQKYHKLHSKPIMDGLKKWTEKQLSDKIVEDNSSLGGALKYLKKHWNPLTLFLRNGKAPLDNNLAERVIKKAVLNRKNAMFYKTLNGAQVGDLFMSLVHTCELNNVSPHKYLTALQQQDAIELTDNAKAWMPWNYTVQPETSQLT
jgi:transposase